MYVAMLIIYTCNKYFWCVCRCVWPVRHGARRKPAGEVTVRARGLRSHAIPRPADALRQAAAATAVLTDRVGAGHRADVLRTTGRQDADWDAHQRYAAQRRLVQLAVHARHSMTSRQAPAIRSDRRQTGSTESAECSLVTWHHWRRFGSKSGVLYPCRRLSPFSGPQIWIEGSRELLM